MKVELDSKFWDDLKKNLKKDIKKEKKTSILAKSNINKSYYILLVGMFFVATLSIYNNIDSQNSVSEENVTSVFANSEESSNLQDTVTNNGGTRYLDDEIINAFKEKPISPVEKESLIESNFLDGITEIKTNLNSNVFCISSGKVEYVYIDYCYGYTVIIDHGNNVKSKYSNLDSNLLVKTGQEVNAGDLIGKTINDDVNSNSILYFTVYYKNEIINIDKIIEIWHI